jgi:hypothetical protein
MGKNPDPGSEINIPDPQHWYYHFANSSPRGIALVFFLFYSTGRHLTVFNKLGGCVADPGCFGMFIPDPDFCPSQIPIPNIGSRIQKQQQKRGVKKNLLPYFFFVATKITKLKITLTFELVKKKL